ncbi:ankyrin [Terfezia boudieri ATCC MYA-4762]|uniref:Ankyrin n=1 Tax=Terfezia boudieri ATCC MYA-4762 TaxID=1051890 RepID=A0A3N4LFL1_9PEZI|nr:ankyrin [Terfezia boudieri ATCC MYA-4762]
MIDASTRLRRAIINNDLLLVKRILKNTPSTLTTPTPPTLTLHPTSPTTPTSLTTLPTTGFTPLHLASTTPNSLPIVTHLIDIHHHESSCISRDNNGNTPLMIACQHNNIPVVDFLARRFPKCLDWKNKLGLTALMIAAKMGFEGCVKVLLEAGRDWGGRGAEKRGGELEGDHKEGLQAGEEDRYDGYESFFPGVDIDAVDGAGNTALHYASAYGHLKTIRTLIEYNASPHIQNRHKYTPQEFSFTSQAEAYFTQLVAEKDARDVAHARITRAATPVPGRNEKQVNTPGRQRASSGS